MSSLPLIDNEDSGIYLRPKQLRVYLACSLTTNDNFALKESVLEDTDRIFREADFTVHNPRRHTPPGSPHEPADVYFEDLWQTINSDFICFVRLGRSLGMGLEAQIGADVLLPWGDISRDGDSIGLSPLLSGLWNARNILRVTVKTDEPESWQSVLAEFLADPARRERLVQAKRARDAAQAIIDNFRFGRHVRLHRLIRGLTIERLGKLTDIDPSWIKAIESDPRYVSKLTLIQVARLCEILDLTFGPQNGLDLPILPRAATPVGVPADLIAEAETVVEYSFETGSPPTSRPTDDALMDKWRRRLAEKNLPFPQYEPPRCDSGKAPLRVALCPPISNLTDDERAAIDRVVEDTRRSLEASGTLVEFEVPEIQMGRHDHGQEIYLKWLAKLRTTDLAIVLLDPPATGVGVMLQVFRNATIPCLCVARDWSAVSRMVRGLAPSHLSHIEYTSPRAFGQKIANWLRANTESIRESRSRRESAWKSLRGLSVRRATTLANVIGSPPAAMPLMREEFLQQLTEHEDMIATVTLSQAAYISRTQNWNIVPGPDGSLVFEPSIADRLPAGPSRQAKLTAARSSLANLFEALEMCDPPIADSAVNRAWSAYMDEFELEAARKERKVFTRSTQDWLKLLRAKDEL